MSYIIFLCQQNFLIFKVTEIPFDFQHTCTTEFINWRKLRTQYFKIMNFRLFHGHENAWSFVEKC